MKIAEDAFGLGPLLRPEARTSEQMKKMTESSCASFTSSLDNFCHRMSHPRRFFPYDYLLWRRLSFFAIILYPYYRESHFSPEQLHYED